ncbi:uncharacterized protein BDV14DRAFT_78356 [Aspergillus stella-maris]|uniref:uncharacterized protein n=1 Tax=Aspergillus stella-maris TaxID=1810926 RepID=UPI003CCE3972
MDESDASANRGWILLAVSWPFFAICTIITGLRFYVRTRLIRSLGWDDAFIFLALVCATLNSVLINISVSHGTGRHTSTLTLESQIGAMKYQVLSQGFHVMATNWGKVSVALFLIRIISEVKNHKRGMYALIVVMTVINAAAVGTIYGQCSPPDLIWDHRVEGSCWPPGAQKKFAYFQGSFSAFTDLILAIYPLFTIKDLQMAMKVKVGLGVVLSLGIIAMVAAIIKTTHLPALTLYKDYTWDTVNLTIWVLVEEYLIILAACIPSLTPLFNIIVRHRSSKRSRSDANVLADVTSPHSRLHSHSHPHSRSHSKIRSNRKGSKHRAGESTTTFDAGSHQAYVPFASVGREFVEYPLTWTQRDEPFDSHMSRGSAGDGGMGMNGHGSGSGSDSEVPITAGMGGFPQEVEEGNGILRTTEFRIREVSSASGFGGRGV